MTTFAYNSSASGATSVTAAQGNFTLRFSDESSNAVPGQTLSLGTYWLNSAIIGTGSAGTLLASNGNDLVLSDDKTETTSTDRFGSGRHGLRNSSPTAAIETFSLGAGNDDLYGGEGIDFLELSDATAGVDFNLSDSVTAFTVASLGTDEIQGFEALILSTFADIVDANALANILYGADGRSDEIMMFGRFALTAESAVGGFFAANTGVSENNGNGVTIGQAWARTPAANACTFDHYE